MTCGTRRDLTPLPVSPLDTALPGAPGAAMLPGVAGAGGESEAPPLVAALPVEPTGEGGSPPSVAIETPPLPRTAGHELARFYAGLRALAQHTRQSHVRVAWLGDSHGAADMWSGPLRAALQARFGDAGPGFVHVGYKSYRHEGIKLDVGGRWVTSPRGPSTSVHTGDGNFGLGGVLLSGSEDSPYAAFTVTAPGLPPTLRWDLCYKPATENDTFDLRVTGLPDRVVRADGPPGGLRHVTFTTTTPSPTLRVVPLGGHPGFCGATVETDPATTPGVILDTLGINGARLTTPLAWNEGAWVTELGRRPPALVIVEYGTNESGDSVIRGAAYVENLRRLMGRVRTASPECDCLVLAPTDRADTLERTPLVRDALRDAAREAGCGFWDTYAIMGGRGSILTWRAESLPRAGGDGVHLTARGYKELGERLTADVLGGYRP